MGRVAPGASAELRLVVGAPGGRRAMSWSAKTRPDGSFYVAPREARGGMKVTLHPPSAEFPDGFYAYGLTKEFFLNDRNEMLPAGHPRLERLVSRTLSGRLVRVCTVQVPYEALNMSSPPRKANRHVWVAPPDPGTARELIFFLADSPPAATVRVHDHFVGEVTSGQGNLVVMQRQVVLQVRPRLTVDLGPTATPEDYAQVWAVGMGTAHEDGTAILTEASAEPPTSAPLA